MLTLGTTAVGVAVALGGKEKSKQQGPPIDAQSKEEEQFIQFAVIQSSSRRRLLTLIQQRISKECRGGGAEGETLELRRQGGFVPIGRVWPSDFKSMFAGRWAAPKNQCHNTISE